MGAKKSAGKEVVAAVPKKLREAAGRNERPEGSAFAEAAGLEWVNDSAKGIRREGKGKKFVYRAASGAVVKEEKTLQRIRSLVIPPAWREVWICASGKGHIQATGIDAKGRKQYRYHARWRTMRDATKFDRMIAFAQALPGIRAATRRHLRLPGLSREKVMAAIVSLLEKTLIRIGNEEYAKENQHFGLTTIRDKHAKVRGSRVDFHFAGKSGVDHVVELHDARLAKVVQECQELPNQELFTFLHEETGDWVDVTSSHVNDYLKEIARDDFTAKDFRTWAGTVMAAVELGHVASPESEADGKRKMTEAVSAVSKRLRNTVAVCRRCYIHPAVFEAYVEGKLRAVVTHSAGTRGRGLRVEERAVLALLRQRAGK